VLLGGALSSINLSTYYLSSVVKRSSEVGPSSKSAHTQVIIPISLTYTKVTYDTRAGQHLKVKQVSDDDPPYGAQIIYKHMRSIEGACGKSKMRTHNESTVMCTLTKYKEMLESVTGGDGSEI
jgi:hypothetical protein